MSILSHFPLLILAAGKSSRMGFPKGLLNWKGETLLKYQIKRFFEMGGEKTIVIMNEENQKLYNTLHLPKKTMIILNHDVELGPFHSLQLGIKTATQSAYPGIFLLPIDCPSPSPQVWKKLAKAFHPSFLATIPQSSFGGGGHPILLHSSFYSHLSLIDVKNPDARLDRQMQKLAPEKIKKILTRDLGIKRNINSL